VHAARARHVLAGRAAADDFETNGEPMSRRTIRAVGTLAAVLLAATLAPSASLADHERRSQDALDAARSLPPEQLVAVAQGLRSTDLRSRDALDAARSLPPEQLVAVSEGLHSGAATEPTAVRFGESDGFHWPSALIGAATLLGLIGVSLAVVRGARQIRRRPAQA
jgi:hypothetical protein